MNMRINKWLALSSVALLVGVVACGDDETSTTGTPSTTASSTTGATGGSGGTTASSTTASSTSGMGGMGPSQACIDGCNELWTCTQEGDLCPGLPPEAEVDFKEGCVSNPLCDVGASLNKGKPCPEMVASVKGLSDDFKVSCEGAGAGGAGGGK